MMFLFRSVSNKTIIRFGISENNQVSENNQGLGKVSR